MQQLVVGAAEFQLARLGFGRKEMEKARARKLAPHCISSLLHKLPKLRVDFESSKLRWTEASGFKSFLSISFYQFLTACVACNRQVLVWRTEPKTCFFHRTTKVAAAAAEAVVLAVAVSRLLTWMQCISRLWPSFPFFISLRLLQGLRWSHTRNTISACRTLMLQNLGGGGGFTWSLASLAKTIHKQISSSGTRTQMVVAREIIQCR